MQTIPHNQITLGHYRAKSFERRIEETVVVSRSSAGDKMVVSTSTSVIPWALEYFEFYERIDQPEIDKKEKRIKDACFEISMATATPYSQVRGAVNKLINYGNGKKSTSEILDSLVKASEYCPEDLNEHTLKIVKDQLEEPFSVPLDRWHLVPDINIVSEKEIRAGYKIRTITEMRSYTLGKCILIMKKKGGSILYQHVNYEGKTIHICDETKRINGG